MRFQQPLARVRNQSASVNDRLARLRQRHDGKASCGSLVHDFFGCHFQFIAFAGFDGWTNHHAQAAAVAAAVVIRNFRLFCLYRFSGRFIVPTTFNKASPMGNRNRETGIYIRAIARRSQEIAADIQEIATDIEEIGIYIKEIAADSREIGIYIEETAIYWTEIATYIREIAAGIEEIGIYIRRNAARSREMAANSLFPFVSA